MRLNSCSAAFCQSVGPVPFGEEKEVGNHHANVASPVSDRTIRTRLDPKTGQPMAMIIFLLVNLVCLHVST
jgi:hypothetical protein